MSAGSLDGEFARFEKKLPVVPMLTHLAACVLGGLIRLRKLVFFQTSLTINLSTMNKNTLNKLSPGLRKFIVPENKKTIGNLTNDIKRSSAPVSRFAQRTLNHTNGGAVMEA